MQQSSPVLLPSYVLKLISKTSALRDDTPEQGRVFAQGFSFPIHSW